LMFTAKVAKSAKEFFEMPNPRSDAINLHFAWVERVREPY
jgi:hypothetical protein